MPPTATSAPKAGSVSISIRIPLAANPFEYAASRAMTAQPEPGAGGTGSNAAAWYAAAASGRIGAALWGTPAASDKHRASSVCTRVHDGHFVVAVTAPKRGASVSAIVRGVLTECVRVPFDGFKNAAQAAGHPVPSRDLHAAADRAMADGATRASIHIIGPITGSTAAKKTAALAKYTAAAAKGAAGAAPKLKRTGKVPNLPVQRAPAELPGMTALPAKAHVAFVLCAFLASANIPAKICGNHVFVTSGAAAKISALGQNKDKREHFQGKLARGDMASLMFSCSAEGLEHAGPVPTPAALAAAVFAAMR